MTRYRSPAVAATAGVDAGGMRVVFDVPQRAVAPGQLIALLDGAEEVLGTATIDRTT